MSPSYRIIRYSSQVLKISPGSVKIGLFGLILTCSRNGISYSADVAEEQEQRIDEETIHGP